jgi:hypothetical protein
MQITSIMRSIITIILIAAFMVVAGSISCNTQELLTQKALSEHAGLIITEGVLERCHADGYHISVVVRCQQVGQGADSRRRNRTEHL